MIDITALSALETNTNFWYGVLIAFCVLLFGLVALLVQVAHLNRSIKALALRLATLETQARQPAPLPKKKSPRPKTNSMHAPSQPTAADIIIPEFSADSMIEKAISMINADETADQIRLKLGIGPELLEILIQQHKPS